MQVAQLFVVPADAAGMVPAAAGGVVTAAPGAVVPAAGAPAPLRIDAPANPDAPPAAVSLKAAGFDMVLAPYADVADPGTPLAGELFSTDPATVTRQAGAIVADYLRAGLIPAVGHFPGQGSASADPDETTATVGGSLAALQARDLVPFSALARTAPVIVMSNAIYTAFDGVTPAALLPQAVALLRDRYGFGGVVMSDDLDADLNPTGLDAGAIAVAALRAGEDLLYITGSASERQSAYAAVLAAVQRSPALQHRLRVAVLRDLTLKDRFGLLG
jgi:beta-N-acetylhexosaminidase